MAQLRHVVMVQQSSTMAEEDSVHFSVDSLHRVVKDSNVQYLKRQRLVHPSILCSIVEGNLSAALFSKELLAPPCQETQSLASVFKELQFLTTCGHSRSGLQCAASVGTQRPANSFESETHKTNEECILVVAKGKLEGTSVWPSWHSA